MIPIRRHLEFASGYLELGMLAEATEELAAIPREEWATSDVLSVRIELHMAKKEWLMVVGFGEQLARRHPKNKHGWISWAYALRALNRIEEAKAVLLEAEPLHGAECGLLHYNLACYACLLSDQQEAKKRLRVAYQMSKKWKQTALDDPDLRAMWDDIAKMK